MMTITLRIALILVSLGTFAMIMRKIRQSRMQIESAIFWIVLALVLVVYSVFPKVADACASLLGIYATTNFLFLFAIFVLILKVFFMSIHISQLESKIKELAQGIMEKSGETVEQADVVKDIIREEQDHIIATREQYQQLEQSIRHSAEEIRKIAGETGRLSQQKEDILGNIGSLSAISEENAANNQQVNANIEEILTQIQTVGANCDKMKQISGELESSVAYFHTEKEPAGK